MLFIVYTGDPGDPLQQDMKLVRGSSYDDVASKNPNSIAISVVERRRPIRQPEISLKKLKKGMPVWSF